MTTGHASTADAKLLKELRQNGITTGGKPISVRQLQTWRRHGLIDRPSTTSHGRHGRASTYGPDTAKQVAQVAGWLSETGRLYEVVLTAFGLGRNPPEIHLRAAYQSYIEHQQVWATAVPDSRTVLPDLTREMFGDTAALGLLGPYLARAVNPDGVAILDGATDMVIPVAALKQARVGDLLEPMADTADGDRYRTAAGLDAFLAELTGADKDEVHRELAHQDIPGPRKHLEQLNALDYNALLRRRDLASTLDPRLGPTNERERGVHVAMLVLILPADAPEVAVTGLATAKSVGPTT